MAETSWVFFLGGCDLEMITIRELLKDLLCHYYDHGLDWGASASHYASEIDSALSRGQTPVLIELNVDLDGALLKQCRVIDHHGPRAGLGSPTSLEQVMDLLQIGESHWNRHLELVAANDRGHIRAMRALTPPATDDEIRTIRELDLQAQGATDADFQIARRAVQSAIETCHGRLTVTKTTGRTGLVAEMLEPIFDGPGFQNLLVTNQSESAFFGEGWLVERLGRILTCPARFLVWRGVTRVRVLGERQHRYWSSIPNPH